MIVRKRGLAAAASLLALSCGHAWAGAAQPSNTVDEVVVTAEKRAENVQRVPIAISVVTADQLRDLHVVEASQLQYVVPSLQEQSTNNQVGGTNFFIRGVGTAIYGPAIESSVGTVIDDVALARPSMGVVQFFDLDQVEVLRGPQGMLFGKNASAGLINIVTAKPKLGQFEAIGHLSYDNANDGSSGNNELAQLALNIPVSANSALRVSGFFTRRDGFGENVFRDEDLGLTEYGGRAKYLWRPNDRFELLVEGDYAHERGPGGSVLYRRFDAPGGFAEALDAASGITASPENTKIASNAATSNYFNAGGVQAKAVWSFGEGYTLTDVVAYRAYKDRSSLDTDLFPISFFDLNDQGRDQWQFSNELRLTSPAGRRLEYQLGLYYLDVSDSGFNTLGANLEPLFPPPPPGFIANLGDSGSSTLRNKNYGAFGQAKLAVTDTARLIVGGRLTYDDIKDSGTITADGFLIPLGGPLSASAKLTETNFSYKVGGEWDVTPDVMGYLTYSVGYKSPTFGGPTGTAAIKPEIPTNLELGLKSRLFDRRLVLNLALYHVDFKDFQAQAYDPSVLHFTTLNAGTLRTQGLEADFTAIPFDGLTLSGGLAYNDAVYKSFPGVACYYGEPTGTSGRNVCLPNGTTDATGNALAFAPKWAGAVQAEYRHPIGGKLQGFLIANYYFRSSVNFTASHDPMTEVDGFGLFGGSFGVETNDGGLRLSVFARNLFDKRVPTLIVADPVAPIFGDVPKGGDYLQQFDEGSFRSIGISLDVRY